MKTIRAVISQELLDDPAALVGFLKRQFAEGYDGIQLELMADKARWHEEDKRIPFGGKPSETQ